MRPVDFALYANFYMLFLHRCVEEEEPQFPRHIYFTYGRCFKLTIQHVWDDKNSHAQHAHGFTVWAGIVHSRLIGPCLHPPRLTCHTYFLQNVLDELLKDVSLDIRQSLRFQDDGALPQVIHSVPGHLYRCFMQRWIGRGGLITKPP